jgi:hypothetical protein
MKTKVHPLTSCVVATPLGINVILYCTPTHPTQEQKFDKVSWASYMNHVCHWKVTLLKNNQIMSH